MLHDFGQGVPQNFADAAAWYRRDDEVALMWFELAAAQGDTSAIDQRAEIVERMPSEQIAAAQRRAAQFRPRVESR